MTAPASADAVILAEAASKLGLAGEERDRFTGAAQVLRVPAGTIVVQPGQTPGHYLFIAQGAVRMQLVAANGRVATLLRIEAGEPCVMTTSCLFSHRPYPVEGIAEAPVTAVVLPVATFDGLFAVSARFRAAVLQAFSDRVGELLTAFETNLFESVPARLARALIARAQDGAVEQTHADLAAEIGSAREVVSRQLSRFAQRGWIGLQRGAILIRDEAALRREGASGAE